MGKDTCFVRSKAHNKYVRIYVGMYPVLCPCRGTPINLCLEECRVLRDHKLPTAQTRSPVPSRNIKPVQDFLRDNQGERTLVSWVSAGFVGNNNHSVVACAEDRIKAETRLNSSVAQTPLAHVMGFLPLRMAFGEFCRKALCSEVRRCIESCV